MNKKNIKIISFLMSFLMVISILPAEYLIGNAFNAEKNVLSFVDTKDDEISIDENSATINAKTYNKVYELKWNFNYEIDYTKNESYEPGKMVYYLMNLGQYDNGVTTNYIMPTDIAVNNSGTEIWDYSTEDYGGHRVIKITNKITLTPEVITEGYMQFATTINPRTQLVGANLNAIQIIASEDGGNTGNKLNSLTWNANLYCDEFNLTGTIMDVQVENVSELGENPDDYYWAKYEINLNEGDLHSLQANNFKFTFTPASGAELVSINGQKNFEMEDDSAVINFNLADWNYTQNIGAKSFVIIVKYPKNVFNSNNNVMNLSNLYVQYLGEDNFDKIADAKLDHELHDYSVNYEGDLFAINTNEDTGYEISWNSLNRGKASPFSFFINSISRFNGTHDITIENDHLEILSTNGTFRRLDDDEYQFNKIIINDLSHFKNSVGEQYSELDFAIIDKDVNLIVSGSVGNNSQIIILPEGLSHIGIVFYDLNKSLYLDADAIQVVGVIKVKDADSVMQNGELRNLVSLTVLDENGNLMNIVNTDNYRGTDADRLAQADKEEYGRYLQRDYASEKVVYKSSQINITATYEPIKSVYNKTTDIQESTLKMESFFASPGEVNSFSLYTVLPKDMIALTDDVSYSSDADLVLFDGSIISAENVDTFLHDYATVTVKEDYKGTGRIYVAIDFDFPMGKAICYDSTMTNEFTSGKISAHIPVQVENKDATYKTVAGMIFNDEHHETITKTTDNGSASLVKNDSLVWTDINNNGNIDEIVDYATTSLTSVFVKADNVPIVPDPEENPAVKIEKTAEKNVYENGETIFYTIKVTNTGDVILHNVKVIDNMDGTYETQDEIIIDKNVATISELAVGESVTLTYKVEVPENSKDGDEIVNIVSVTTDENVTDEDDETVIIKVTEIPPIEEPSIKIEKIADKTIYQNGETVLYTIKVTNNGNTTLHNIIVTDKLNGIFEKTDFATTDKNVATISELAMGESVTLIYKVEVPESSKDGDKIINIVSVTTDEDVEDEDEETVTVEVPEIPSIKIEKTADKSVYTVKDTVIYTIKVTNTGNKKLTNVKITESMDGYFDTTNKDILTIDGKVANIGTLLPNESKTIIFKYIVPANAKNGDILNNIVTVTTDENVTDKDNVTVKIEVPETNINVPGIEITKTANKTTFNPDETIIYTIKVRNSGNVTLKDIKVIETLSGTWSNISKNVVIKDSMNASIIELKPGQSETLTFEFKIASNAKDGSSIKNIVKAEETTYNVSDTDDVIVTVIQKLVPAITISKSTTQKSVKSGETIKYTITVKNTGNVDLNNINVIDSLVDGSFDDFSGVTKVNNYSLIIPSLKINESKTFTFSYKVPDNSTINEITNIATAINTDYNLRVEDKVVTPTTKTVIETVTNIVQTGDNAPLIILFALAVISLIGMCVVTHSAKRRK